MRVFWIFFYSLLGEGGVITHSNGFAPGSIGGVLVLQCYKKYYLR
jgi:hypothetical protein